MSICAYRYVFQVFDLLAVPYHDIGTLRARSHSMWLKDWFEGAIAGKTLSSLVSRFSSASPVYYVVAYHPIYFYIYLLYETARDLRARGYELKVCQIYGKNN